MSREQRSHPRIQVPLNVCLKYADDGQLVAVTRDISDGGIFLVMEGETIPAIGDTVRVQVQGIGSGEDASWVEMKVVREEASGVGLMIVD